MEISRKQGFSFKCVHTRSIPSLGMKTFKIIQGQAVKQTSCYFPLLSGWDVPLPKTVSVENLLLTHLRSVTVALVGHPPGSLPSPLPTSPSPIYGNGLTSSNLPVQQCSSIHPPPHASSPAKINTRVLPKQTLSFPDTPVQHHSGTCDSVHTKCM